MFDIEITWNFLALIAPKLENLMTQSSSKMSVKFFQDCCQRYPEFMLGSTESILKFTSTAINGYRKTIASDLLLKMAKSGKNIWMWPALRVVPWPRKFIETTIFCRNSKSKAKNAFRFASKEFQIFIRWSNTSKCIESHFGSTEN